MALLTLFTPPAINAVALADAKLHVRVDHDEEDLLIQSYIDTATQRLDGRDGALGCCLITQVWKLTLDRFTPMIPIPLPPCQSIDAISYVDPQGATQALPPADWQAAALGTIGGAYVQPAPGKPWPATATMPEAVTITFTAGFGDHPVNVPDAIRANILANVARLYEYRDAMIEGEDLPDGVDDLVRSYRPFVF